ncbi:hypothetical protein AMIS_35780 [Actinoplanes missouriensis 431]|uniref:Uncharacterized protein n=1 Tax=Actinoplanes missouriensis (strain ATCC 14538 / DSM 43046 / CBS 188.64 / JCM 3121 / NBRC 102363 / NCIMB 12654 / NRRL B-3342 / UNCC 431) TaxID=512565 RepID=I0H711_ACTM4|nr:hypothetical protein [Actinoplanes missouriensis]BAL88798.1 hypothetical protein AMIS_35780 [Actinoplanes missouriensis 431]
MSTLIDDIFDGYGGRRAWQEAERISARQFFGGVLWAMKGHPGALDDVQVTVDLHREHTRQEPFFDAGHHTDFTPGRIAVETEDGQVVEELLDPRASFAGHELTTPWTRLQLAYFSGYAMWTYTTEPASLVLPGVTTEEIGTWTEDGQTFRRLAVTYPDSIATHTPHQILYVDADGLIRRRDYTVDIAGKAASAQYALDFTTVDGLVVPTSRKIYSTDENNRKVPDPLIVSIDLKDVTVH